MVRLSRGFGFESRSSQVFFANVSNCLKVPSQFSPRLFDSILLLLVHDLPGEPLHRIKLKGILLTKDLNVLIEG